MGYDVFANRPYTEKGQLSIVTEATFEPKYFEDKNCASMPVSGKVKTSVSTAEESFYFYGSMTITLVSAETEEDPAGCLIVNDDNHVLHYFEQNFPIHFIQESRYATSESGLAYYYKGFREGFFQLPLDVYTFKNGYAVGESFIYFNETLLSHYEAASFEILDSKVGKRFAKDSKYVYGNGEILAADPQTFSILSPYYQKDSKTVFFQGVPIESADAASFEILSFGTAVDRQSVYSHGKAATEVDPSSVVMLNDVYFIDKNGIFAVIAGETKKITNVDPATFQAYPCGFATDKNAIYYHGTSISELSAEQLRNPRISDHLIH